ncbi:MAG: hypothetical protein M1823_003277 [Watsoniomyces obsoletus]|nr:MAG: hypothetical protein M1823_003277 [Watsoniomyces obsoletus]
MADWNEPAVGSMEGIDNAFGEWLGPLPENSSYVEYLTEPVENGNTAENLTVLATTNAVVDQAAAEKEKDELAWQQAGEEYDEIMAQMEGHETVVETVTEMATINATVDEAAEDDLLNVLTARRLATEQDIAKAFAKTVENHEPPVESLTQAVCPAGTSPKKTRKTHPGPKKRARRGKNGYEPTDTEKLLAGISAFCQENGVTEEEMKIRIWANPRKKDNSAFWNRMAGLMSERKLDSVKKHVKRNFYPFERTPWTPGLLKQLQERAECYEPNKRNWQKIGKELSRHPDDCRETFRTKCFMAPNQVKGTWSVAEVKAMLVVVDQVEEETRIQWRNENPGQDEMAKPRGDFISADTVSDRMGGTRNRSQVQLKLRDLGIKGPKET